MMNDVLQLRFAQKMLENGYQQWDAVRYQHLMDAELEIQSFSLATFRI